MKIKRSTLKRLILEILDHPGDEYRYLAKHPGEHQSRRLSSSEQYANAKRYQDWQAALADEGLDEDWIIDVVSSGENEFLALVKAAGNEYPEISNPENTLLRIIADSEIIHLDDASQTVNF